MNESVLMKKTVIFASIFVICLLFCIVSFAADITLSNGNTFASHFGLTYDVNNQNVTAGSEGLILGGNDYVLTCDEYFIINLNNTSVSSGGGTVSVTSNTVTFSNGTINSGVLFVKNSAVITLESMHVYGIDSSVSSSVYISGSSSSTVSGLCEGTITVENNSTLVVDTGTVLKAKKIINNGSLIVNGTLNCSDVTGNTAIGLGSVLPYELNNNTSSAASLPEASNTSEYSETFNKDVFATYYSNSSTVFYSVNVEFGDMRFKYVGKIWDPATHTYVGSDGSTETGWFVLNNSNGIKVINHTNAALTATFEYIPKTGFDAVSGKFYHNNTEIPGNKLTLADASLGESYGNPANAPSKSANLLLNGVLPNTAGTDSNIGTIKITFGMQ